MSEEKGLRTGFTTGTCATAAAKAGIECILQQTRIEKIPVILPNRSIVEINITSCKFDEKSAFCSVIKDGGDDPDVTHGAEIQVEVKFTTNSGTIEIKGGMGVGVVTKPGLGLELNKPAINPTPKKMIRENIQNSLGEILNEKGVSVMITVPDGKEIGLKTDNPRLGIINGISILGTSGIVKPFSTAAYAASIRQSIDVSRAMNEDVVILTTGGRSETFARKIITDKPDHAFIQMGDFSGYTIQQCAKKNIKKAYIVGFIGKLAKIAAGVKQTHVKGSKIDKEFLAKLADSCGATSDIIEQIKKANTARHIMEIVINDKIENFFDKICLKVYEQMRDHSENKVDIDVILFNFDGDILARYNV